MGALIWIIDKVLIHKGKKALGELEKSCEDPRRANEELLLRILRENANTEYGRKYNFASIKSVDDY